MYHGRKNPFWFGRNWVGFQRLISGERIAVAEDSIRELAGLGSLSGRSFADIGSGSGLFSLAAVRLGASPVVSVDVDPESVAASRKTREEHAPQASWRIEEGSVLDRGFVESLGQFDVVYSWGVLHHTGDMWTGVRHVALLVKEGGLLCLGLYGDAGWKTRVVRSIAKLLHHTPKSAFWLVAAPIVALMVLRTVLKDLVRGKPLDTMRSYKRLRGMSYWHDVVDGLASYPYEFTTSTQLSSFLAPLGLTLVRERQYPGRAYVCEYCFVRSR